LSGPPIELFGIDPSEIPDANSRHQIARNARALNRRSALCGAGCQILDLPAACNALAGYDGSGKLDAKGGWLSVLERPR
jgi:hypothetical protein